MSADEATILHADLDAFYASVEQLLDPLLRGQPIAVGAGVVLAASYEARASGVRAGMPAWRARQLCPDLRFVEGHFREYQRLGDEVMGVMHDFTPLVERISIDEAFLDVRSTVRLFGQPGDIAAQIRNRVRSEIGLPLSIGVARTKHLAKVASQVAKPDGLVGMLQQLLGSQIGLKLACLAANLDPRAIQLAQRARSMGAQSALGRRRPTPELIHSTMGYLCERVAGRLRASGSAGRTVDIRIRFTGLRSIIRAVTLPFAVSSTRTLTETAVDLVETALAARPDEREITLLGVSVTNLAREDCLQLELPLALDEDGHRPGTAHGAARWALDRTVDVVRERFGRIAVGYGSALLSESNRVPEEFRELAEHPPSVDAT